MALEVGQKLGAVAVSDEVPINEFYTSDHREKIVGPDYSDYAAEDLVC